MTRARVCVLTTTTNNRCIARGLANEPYLGNVIGGTIEFETSGWADGEPRFWHVDGRGARCATGKLGYPADATMKMTVNIREKPPKER